MMEIDVFICVWKEMVIVYDQNSPNNKWSQETFQRISELERLEQYQAKLFIMKEQMKNNLHWRNATILGGILLFSPSNLLDGEQRLLSFFL